jgi:endonuclease VIII
VDGPSLHLAAEQLQPFVGKRIRSVSGNSKIGVERLSRLTVRSIFAWGKHLVFQFDDFALRVHFMLWGTFAATVDGASVTGDYRRAGPPRLVLTFSNGEITMWAASIRFVEDADARATYDFTADIMAPEWNAKAAFRKARAFARSEIADVLLDQDIFAGVGNIIKNEVLFRTRVSPFTKVQRISDRKRHEIVSDARTFSFRFLELRKTFSLRRTLDVYGRSICSRCGGKIGRRVHGRRERRSFFCMRCQDIGRIPRPASESPRTSKPRSSRGTSTRTAARRGGPAPKPRALRKATN